MAPRKPTKITPAPPFPICNQVVKMVYKDEIVLQIMCSIMNQHNLSYLDDDKIMDNIVKLSLRYADKFIQETDDVK